MGLWAAQLLHLAQLKLRRVWRAMAGQEKLADTWRWEAMRTEGWAIRFVITGYAALRLNTYSIRKRSAHVEFKSRGDRCPVCSQYWLAASDWSSSANA